MAVSSGKGLGGDTEAMARGGILVGMKAMAQRLVRVGDEDGVYWALSIEVFLGGMTEFMEVMRKPRMEIMTRDLSLSRKEDWHYV